MAPPAMGITEPFVNGHPEPKFVANKTSAVPHKTAVPVSGVATKYEAIEEMAGNWGDFKFAPIRESQVSRASKLDIYFFTHSLNYG
jgi:hypothetical protein